MVLSNQETKGDSMDNVKKHVDTIFIMISIVASILSSMLWMNGKFNDLEKDLAIVKTVLVMQKIMPGELAVKVGDE